ncbi:DUF4148 domain-containing protein [Paraburkholderia sp. RP-4-7]|uniref:DUF4148 domain-containing protein n=1 Tax=Paraburkholderia polaris TaxID=2728848 RepID=A0A848IID3_9BURK|nr:DUF4148 domain-containing protein [Paraburkholderia polaris]NMM02042.1 DUF4148 domain-containing protein [Paraburkholderia polaris]
MKSLIQAVVVAVALVAPVASFAQSNAPKTRAEVRAELVQLEKAGYNPAARDNTTYPAEIQAAEARVSAQSAVAQAPVADTSGVGGVAGGSSASGAAQPTSYHDGMKPIYFGQ